MKPSKNDNKREELLPVNNDNYKVIKTRSVSKNDEGGNKS